MRVCLAASAGGHLQQLLHMSSVWSDHDCFFATTDGIPTAEMPMRHRTRVYVVGESNHQHPLKVARTFLKCARILVRERPDVILSTGAAHGCLMCLLGKAMGSTIVWIDSIANVDRPSLSGRIVRYVADLFLVQWPDLVRRYPKARYVGELV